jgi:hypothetical protein
MGDPRARTLAHLQHLLAAAAVGVTVSSCSKEEIRQDPASGAESAQPPGSAVASDPTLAPTGSSAPGSIPVPIDSVATPGGPADAGADASADAGGAVVTPRPPKPPPTGYRVVDPLPPPTSRGGKGF